MAFQPLVMSKGDRQRIVQSAVEQVQAEHEGYAVDGETPKKITAALNKTTKSESKSD